MFHYNQNIILEKQKNCKNLNNRGGEVNSTCR